MEPILKEPAPAQSAKSPTEKISDDIWKFFQASFEKILNDATLRSYDKFITTRRNEEWSGVIRQLVVLQELAETPFKIEIKRLNKEVEELQSQLEKEKSSSAKKDELNNKLRLMLKEKKGPDENNETPQ